MTFTQPLSNRHDVHDNEYHLLGTYYVQGPLLFHVHHCIKCNLPSLQIASFESKQNNQSFELKEPVFGPASGPKVWPLIPLLFLTADIDLTAGQ